MTTLDTADLDHTDLAGQLRTLLPLMIVSRSRALGAAVMLLEVLEHADADTLERHRTNIARVLDEALCSVATEGEA